MMRGLGSLENQSLAQLNFRWALRAESNLLAKMHWPRLTLHLLA
jgi:hypothetical protein